MPECPHATIVESNGRLPERVSDISCGKKGFHVPPPYSLFSVGKAEIIAYGAGLQLDSPKPVISCAQDDDRWLGEYSIKRFLIDQNKIMSVFREAGMYTSRSGAPKDTPFQEMKHVVIPGHDFHKRRLRRLMKTLSGLGFLTSHLSVENAEWNPLPKREKRILPGSTWYTSFVLFPWKDVLRYGYTIAVQPRSERWETRTSSTRGTGVYSILKQNKETSIYVDIRAPACFSDGFKSVTPRSNAAGKVGQGSQWSMCCNTFHYVARPGHHRHFHSCSGFAKNSIRERGVGLIVEMTLVPDFPERRQRKAKGQVGLENEKRIFGREDVSMDNFLYDPKIEWAVADKVKFSPWQLSPLRSAAHLVWMYISYAKNIGFNVHNWWRSWVYIVIYVSFILDSDTSNDGSRPSRRKMRDRYGKLPGDYPSIPLVPPMTIPSNAW
ncbi:uncharacterized protein EI90DRAFT_3015959 [Cantharellus anzutake]|uniref:uncharacterized protein n=1 Tax=Cantharellus anzutake TaxID=1750568 RepID=UPI001906CAF4|nr:uncharacterized protein EI90DRAFT_3015959 [Cantharellus anzutake]KAF8332373.1 hypothetical protein EI90DRAFT_3015959 [Cantharellus anzutake]